jgi:hypothetical protein
MKRVTEDTLELHCLNLQKRRKLTREKRHYIQRNKIKTKVISHWKNLIKETGK